MGVLPHCKLRGDQPVPGAALESNRAVGTSGPSSPVTAETNTAVTPRPRVPPYALFCNRRNRHDRYAAPSRALSRPPFVTAITDMAVTPRPSAFAGSRSPYSGLVARSNPFLPVSLDSAVRTVA